MMDPRFVLPKGCPDGWHAKSNCHYMKLTGNCRHLEFKIPEPVPPPTGSK